MEIVRTQYQNVNSMAEAISVLEKRQTTPTPAFPTKELQLDFESSRLKSPFGDYYLGEIALRHLLGDQISAGLRTWDACSAYSTEHHLVRAINENLSYCQNLSRLILRKYGEEQVAIAVPSGSYAFVDDLEVLEGFQAFHDSEMPHQHLRRGYIGDDLTSLMFTDDTNVVEPQEGDVVEVGVNYKNSATKRSKLIFESCTFRLVCKNGMTVCDKDHTRGFIHSGKIPMDRVFDAYVEIYNLARKEAQHLPKLIGVKPQVSEMQFLHLKLRELLGKRRFEKMQVINTLEESKDLYDLWNAITAFPHTMEDSDFVSKSEMERLGGQFLTKSLKRLGLVA